MNLIIRCDHRVTHDGEPGKASRCRAYRIGPPSMSLPDLRAMAANDGWTHRPGRPYEHIGATDYCPDHTPRKAGN